MTSLFQQLTSFSSVTIFQQHQRIEFKFHNAYVILGLVKGDFMDRVQLLTQKAIKQGYVAPRLKSSLQKIDGRHHELVDHYEISISKWH